MIEFVSELFGEICSILLRQDEGIGNAGPIKESPSSADLTLMDISLWGFIKENVLGLPVSKFKEQ